MFDLVEEINKFKNHMHTSRKQLKNSITNSYELKFFYLYFLNTFFAKLNNMTSST